MRVFLDANVLFSASNRDSNISRLIDRLFEVGTAVTCDLAGEEARRNLQLKRSGWSKELDRLMQRVEVVTTWTFPLPVMLIPHDRPMLCSAIRANCDYFVTGDRRDFGHLYDQQVLGVTVISVLRLAELLSSPKPQDPI